MHAQRQILPLDIAGRNEHWIADYVIAFYCYYVGPDDPLIQALIDKLPPEGPWNVDDRINWLKLLTMAFQIAYGSVENIEIKKEAAN